MHTTHHRLSLALAVSVVALGGSTAISAASVAGAAHPVVAQRSCQGITARGEHLRVVIDRGHVSCRVARSVLRDFMSGKGVKHGGPSSAQTYWTLRGWRCGTGAGGGVCIRHGKTYRTARDRISALG